MSCENETKIVKITHSDVVVHIEAQHVDEAEDDVLGVMSVQSC